MQVGSRCHLWMKSGGRDPLGFRSIFSGFGHFQIIFFLENYPWGIKNSKVSKKNLGNQVFRTRSDFCKKNQYKISNNKKVTDFLHIKAELFFENFNL